MNPLDSALFRPKQSSQSRDVFLAAALLAGAFALRLWLDPILGDDFPYLLMFVPTAFAAWRCPWIAAACVALTGFALANWFFTEPRSSLQLHGAAARFGAVAYAVVSAAIIAFGAILQRQDRRLRRELADRRQAEEELRRVAQFPEENPSAVMRVGQDGTVLYANPASHSLLKAWKCRVGEKVPERLRTWLAETTQAERVDQFDESADDRTFRFTAAPFPLLGYVNLYSTDVTEMKRVEEAKARTLERFHLLSDVSGRLLATEDPKPIIENLCREVMAHLGCDVFFNYLVDDSERRFHLNAFAGISEEQARKLEWLESGFSIRQDASPEQQPIAVESLRAEEAPPEWMQALGIRSSVGHPLIAGGATLGILSFGRRDGKAFAQDAVELAKRIADQVAVAVERIRAAEALRRSEERFRIMADASPAMIWISDRDRAWTWLNRAWLDFVGKPLEEQVGAGWLDSLHPEDRTASREIYSTAFDRREPFKMECRLRHHGGGYRWLLACGTPMYGATGEFQGYVGSCVDVHERRLQQEDLERAVRERTAQLQESVGELESFSYSIAHDMRAPLRAMHGFAKILAQEAAPQLDANGKEYLRRIIASAHRLDALIQDVLSYSRIARGELPLEDVPLQPFIREILLSYPNFAKDRADIVIETPLPPVSANPAALTQVISNLLGNAVKFVSPGVLPRVRVSAATANGHVTLSFRDNGIGIDLESRERIFQMFQRLHRADVYEGTGIGLAIVRKAVERMGGSVAVESEPGEGSTFHVTLRCGTT